MSRFKYSKSLDFTKPDYYFTLEEKNLFLQIPHQIISSTEKIDEIDFRVPENGQYSPLNRVSLINIKEILTDKEVDHKETRFLLYDTVYMEEESPGTYIKSNHGKQTFDLMKELLKYDEVNAKKLLEEYYELALQSDEITTSVNRIVKDTSVMIDYLHKANIVVDNYHVNFKDYSLLEDEDEKEKFVDDLYKKYSNEYDFQAYNDLDYTPAIVNGEYQIYDSSSSSLFVVRDNDNIKKIYKVRSDFVDIACDTDDRISEFAFIHYQRNILLSEAITEKYLIGEIDHGVLTKATIDLTHFDLLQSLIVEELRKEEKIVYEVPNLTFKELLKNYTLQHGSYHIEERCLLKLFKDIVVEEGHITYMDFSAMDLNQEIKHETISESSTRDFKDNNLSQLSHLKNIPEEYQEQIVEYLEQLQEKYDNQYTTIFVNYIRKNLGSQKKNKLK